MEDVGVPLFQEPDQNQELRTLFHDPIVERSEDIIIIEVQQKFDSLNIRKLQRTATKTEVFSPPRHGNRTTHYANYYSGYRFSD